MTTSRTTLPLLILLSRVFLALAVSVNKTTTPMVPAIIVFGDSIVDPGNNNVIPTTIKCNFPPYGKDFVGHKPTGRFSNGRVPGDMIASALGVKDYVPPYLGTVLTPEDILTGVSFASGATGYDPLTPVVVSVLSMPDELKLFKEYKEKLRAIAGEERAANIISQSFYLVCSGTDDIANTYFTTPLRRPVYDIPSYVTLTSNSAANFTKELYLLGARRIAFIGLPPIGCLPSQRTLGGGILRMCEPSRNEAAMLFNSKIQREIRRLASEFKGSKIVYLDIYSIIIDIIEKPFVYGFEEVTKGCCGTGEIEVTLLCNSATSSTCPDDTKYLFWDSYHPTERGYQIIVDKLLQRYMRDLF